VRAVEAAAVVVAEAAAVVAVAAVEVLKGARRSRRHAH